jgi:hypothetical protein
MVKVTEKIDRVFFYVDIVHYSTIKKRVFKSYIQYNIYQKEDIIMFKTWVKLLK